MEWNSSSGSILFICHCCDHLIPASHFGCNIPCDFSLYAFTVSPCYGVFDFSKFLSLSILNRTYPSLQFSQVTSNIIEAIVSVQRLSSFLTAEELQPHARKLEQSAQLQFNDVVSIVFLLVFIINLKCPWIVGSDNQGC